MIVDAPAGRLRLLVAYDGGPFAGWQSQANGQSVQDHLERALATLCGVDRIVVHGSGRTDAGVHALGQVAHADVPDLSRHSPERWTLALNAHLPPEIRVLSVRRAPPGFHARFSATGKFIATGSGTRRCSILLRPGGSGICREHSTTAR